MVKKKSKKKSRSVKKHVARKSAKVSGKVAKGSVRYKEKVLPPTSHNLTTEKDMAMDFAMKVYKKFDRLIKASILFGSQVKQEGVATVGSDIDIILIVDDASINWDAELVAWYREELGKIISAQKYGSQLHVNSVKLTTWWMDLLHGDPVVINILRYGQALIDYAGFFNPIKALLLQGKIKSTPEAVSAALQRVPGHIARSRASEMGAIEGAYWAMIDSAQAMLMTAGKMPPSPEHIPEMLRKTFVEARMLKPIYVKKLNELVSVHKAIMHGMLTNIKGQDVDEWQEVSEEFMKEATRIIDILLEKHE
ncbi:MAG: hypothetical protein KC506_03620 [Nanoarchaeota archaeon]|nr:hypothetical protein [Nanoarchaeota archaeon]